MKKLGWIAALAVCAALAGCSEPVVDTTSEQKMQNSIQQVRNALPEARRTEFDDALQVLLFADLNMGQLFANPEGATAGIERDFHARVQGLTGEEIIQAADRLITERKARECQQAKAEIAELEARHGAAAAALTEMEAFEVTRSRFVMRPRSYGGADPLIELTVVNGTAHAISRAYFEGTLASPGRAVPWHQDRFNYQIPGGLEPGEEASWRLSPSYAWHNIQSRDDAVFTVTVQRLDGADGERLLPSVEFSERDDRRLKDLRERYPAPCPAGS